MPDQEGNPTFFDRLERSLYNPYTTLAKKVLPKNVQDSYLGAAVFGITGALDLPGEALLGGVKQGVVAGKQALESAKQGDVLTGTLQGVQAVASPAVGAMAGTVGLPIIAGMKAGEHVIKTLAQPEVQAHLKAYGGAYEGAAIASKILDGSVPIIMAPAASYLKVKKDAGYPVSPADEAAGNIMDLGWNAFLFHKMGQAIEGARVHTVPGENGPHVVAEPELLQKADPKAQDQTHIQKNYKEFDPDLTGRIKAVAYKVGDKIIPGDPSDVHALLYDKLSKEEQDAVQLQYAKGGEKHSAGFVTHDGQFFTKHQLLNMQKELAAREEALPKLANTDHAYDFSKLMTFEHYVDISRRLRNNEAIMKRKMAEAPDPTTKYEIYRKMGLPVQVDREAMSFYNNRHSLKNMGYTDADLDFDHGIKFDQFYNDRTQIRTKVKDQIKTSMPGLSEKQIDNYSFMNEEFAAHWAKWNGKPATEWFMNRFADGGGFRAGESGLPNELKQDPASDYLDRVVKNAKYAVRTPDGKVYGAEHGDYSHREIIDRNKIPYKDTEHGFQLPDGTFLTRADVERNYADLSGRKDLRKGWSEDVLPQSANAPIFHSVLQRSIEDKMPEKASPLQVRNIAYQYAKKDEVKWTGLDDFLDSKKGQPVTKQEVMDHLRQNVVEVKEVMKSEDTILKDGFTNEQMRTQWEEPYSEDGHYKGDVASVNDMLADRAGHVPKWSDLSTISGNGVRFGILKMAGKWRVVDFEYGDGLHGDRFNSKEEAQNFAHNLIRHREGNVETQYSDYSVPGGKNYRELLLTLPEKKLTPEEDAKRMAGDQSMQEKLDKYIEGAYESPHWGDVKDVLAHVRMQDFTDAQGKRVLFLEELQSDWHQTGRKEGYGPYVPLTELPKDVEVVKVPRQGRTAKGEYWQANWDNMGHGTGITVEDDPSGMRAREEALILYNQEHGRNRVPSGPFSKSWHEMALRRMLRYAAENGYDRVAWTPGKWQAARWEGADEAAEGMPGFYDKMMPDYLNKYGKKWGAKVGETQLKGLTIGKEADGSYFIMSDRNQMDQREEIRNAVVGFKSRKAASTVPSIDVTDAMKKSVMEKGQPLFQSSSSSRANEYIRRVTQNSRKAIKYKGEVIIEDPGMRSHEQVASKHPGARQALDEHTDALLGLYKSQEGRTDAEDLAIRQKAKGMNKAFDKDYQEGYVRPDGTFVSKSDIEQTFRDLSGGKEHPMWQKKAGMSAEEFSNLMGDGAKGSIHFQDQKAIITAFSKADFSTLVHETAHVYRRDLPPELLAEAERFIGVKDGNWTVEHEEKFARSFEKYLRDGEAPSPILRQVFENFKKWLTDIYMHVSGSELDVKVHPNIKKVFDQMLGSEETVPVKKGGNRVIKGSKGADGPLQQKMSDEDFVQYHQQQPYWNELAGEANKATDKEINSRVKRAAVRDEDGNIETAPWQGGLGISMLFDKLDNLGKLKYHDVSKMDPETGKRYKEPEVDSHEKGFIDRYGTFIPLSVTREIWRKHVRRLAPKYMPSSN